MTVERTDGGSVHPTALRFGDREVVKGGLSLRDWFAGQAPKGDIEFSSVVQAAAFAGVSVPDAGDMEGVMRVSAAIVAKLAYVYADAMLSERAKGSAA